MLKRINYWRVLEPLLLGFVSNLAVNIIFNPSAPSKWWSIEELIVAILFCTLITEANRFVEKKIESKYNWRTGAKKRFFYQLLNVAIILIFLVNVIGRIYHWLIDDEFYMLSEVIIINLIVFIITFFLVIFKWTSHFYKEWKTSQINLEKTNVKFEKLASKLQQTNESIKLRKKNSDHIVNAKDLRVIKSDFGVVKVFMINKEWYIFQGTLSKITSLLPENLFFPVTRNMIVHFEQIISLTSSTYGKIQVKLKDTNSTEIDITVSRLKASAFRKWYHSTSSIKL